MRLVLRHYQEKRREALLRPPLERYTANDLNRCYFCKNELFSRLEPLAREHHLRYIAYGINKDDESDFIARIPELPGCRVGLVRNPHESLALADALAEHIISSLDNLSEAAQAAE